MTTRHRPARITRASGDGRTIEMRALAYDVLDSYRTVFARGFGAEELKRRLPRLAWAHQFGEPIGVATAGRSTDDGVYLTARLSDPDAVPRARQAAAQVADGTLLDVSIGFETTDDRAPTDAERKRWPGVERIIVDGIITEVSLVMAGAVPGAEILAVRAPGRAGTLDRLVDVALALADEIGGGNHVRRRELSELLGKGLDALDTRRGWR
jgi:HK97 family phage prohead protease